MFGSEFRCDADIDIEYCPNCGDELTIIADILKVPLI